MTPPKPARPRLQVVALTVENIKTIKAVHIEPDGALVQVSGPNGSGKSSVLDSIWWALQGKKVIQDQPIRRGQKEAMIRVDFGRLVVTRYFRLEADGEYTTSLTVESADGETFSSPQSLLDNFYSSLSFDPLAFMARDRKGKVDDLRRLVNLDVDFDALDRQNKTDFDKRTEVNRRVKSLEERVALHSKGADAKAPVDPIETTDLLAQMRSAAETNADIEREKLRREARREEARQMGERADRLESEAMALRKRADELAAESVRMNEESAKAFREVDSLSAIQTPVDVADVQRKIEEANAENAKRTALRTQRDNLLTAKRDLAEAESQAQALTDAMDGRTKQKNDALAGAKMPVDGLEFGEGGVLYKGIPIEQASGGELLRVSCAIGMAMNPELGVILMKSGPLLDESGVEQVRQWAEENGYQAWMERVGAGKVGIVMEGGEAHVAGE